MADVFDRPHGLASRPTEAQLRWAQFHHKKGAQDVRERVERMLLTPASVHDVEGADTEDGYSTATTDEDCTSSDGKLDENTTKAKTCASPRVKASISRGRRAVLRRSKRALEQRHEHIKKFGYRHYIDMNTNEDDFDSAYPCLTANNPSDAHFGTHDKRQRRQQQIPHHYVRRISCVDNEERLHRFEAAVLAHAEMASRCQEEQIRSDNRLDFPSSNKKWTRSDNLHETPIDYCYSDNVRWGATKSVWGAIRNPKLLGSGQTPIDRGATWLQKLYFNSGNKKLGTGDPMYASQSPYHHNRDVHTPLVRRENSMSLQAIPFQQTAFYVEKFEQAVSLAQSRHEVTSDSITPRNVQSCRWRSRTSLDSNSTNASDFLREMFSEDADSTDSPNDVLSIFRRNIVSPCTPPLHHVAQKIEESNDIRISQVVPAGEESEEQSISPRPPLGLVVEAVTCRRNRQRKVLDVPKSKICVGDVNAAENFTHRADENMTDIANVTIQSFARNTALESTIESDANDDDKIAERPDVSGPGARTTAVDIESHSIKDQKNNRSADNESKELEVLAIERSEENRLCPKFNETEAAFANSGIKTLVLLGENASVEEPLLVTSNDELLVGKDNIKIPFAMESKISGLITSLLGHRPATMTPTTKHSKLNGNARVMQKKSCTPSRNDDYDMRRRNGANFRGEQMKSQQNHLSSRDDDPSIIEFDVRWKKRLMM